MNVLGKGGRFALFGIPFAVAITVRAVTFLQFRDSALPFYNAVAGLDMATLLAESRSFFRGFGNISVTNVLFSLTIPFGEDGNPNPLMIAAMQHLLGATVAGMTACMYHRLFGGKLYAIASGLLVALYAPAILYECFALKESAYLFAATCSLLMLVRLRPFTQLSASRCFSAGVTLVLPPLTRHAGILWTLSASLWFLFRAGRTNFSASQRNLSGFFRTTWPFISGILLLFTVVALYNWRISGNPAPIPLAPGSYSYYLQLGACDRPANVNLPAETDKTSMRDEPLRIWRFLHHIKPYGTKVAAILLPYEIPNNINYYFVRNHLPPLPFLIGPLLIVPLGVCGLILVLLRSSFRRRAAPLLLQIASYAVPLVLFLPLARLRLVLIPAFAICAVLYISFILRNLLKRPVRRYRSIALCAIPACCIVFTFSIPGHFPIRATDAYIHGRALSLQTPADPEIAGFYELASRLEPDLRYDLALGEQLLRVRQPERSAEFLIGSRFRDRFPVKVLLIRALFAAGDPATARNVLESPPFPENDEEHSVALFYQGELLRISGNQEEARNAYQKSLEYATSEEQRAFLQSVIRSLPEKSTTSP
jgi:tetratricopeptide (TPR) repeat protein